MLWREYYGIKFYREKATGYWRSSKNRGMLAHRWVWENVHGPIPEGMHIHHVDGDKSNNDFSNLQALTVSEHLRGHMTVERRERARRWVAEIRPLTKAWHASTEGAEWHSQHGKLTFERKNPIEFQCDCCGNKFSADVMDSHHVRFCSNSCKSKHRRDSGIDDIEDFCDHCFVMFKRNKYAKSRFCSKSCGRKAYWHSLDKKKREG